MVEQNAEGAATLALVTRFVESVGRCDLDALMADMTGDVVYENRLTNVSHTDDSRNTK
jgi:ketosteroid isomerase-like protein